MADQQGSVPLSFINYWRSHRKIDTLVFNVWSVYKRERELEGARGKREKLREKYHVAVQRKMEGDDSERGRQKRKVLRARMRECRLTMRNLKVLIDDMKENRSQLETEAENGIVEFAPLGNNGVHRFPALPMPLKNLENLRTADFMEWVTKQRGHWERPVGDSDVMTNYYEQVANGFGLTLV